MKEEIYRVVVKDGRETTVKACRPENESPKGIVVLGHGMANDMENPVVVYPVRHLAERGWLALRFNFLYREAGKDKADSSEVLVRTYNRVCEDALSRWDMDSSRLVVGGKSLAARTTALAVRQGLEAAALVYLGFPLHPPGKPEMGRENLIQSVGGLPQLFLAGTRDHLCPLPRLQELVKHLPGPVHLHVIEGGDHSFDLPKNSPRNREDVLTEVARVTGDWVDQVF